MRKPNKPVFAVIRLDPELADLSQTGGSIPQASVSVTVKEIVMTQAEAEAEVLRLNEINKDKGCHYYWQQTRWVCDEGNASPEVQSV